MRLLKDALARRAMGLVTALPAALVLLIVVGLFLKSKAILAVEPLSNVACTPTGVFKSLGGGNYQYTLSKGLPDYASVSYDPSQTQRVGLQVRGDATCAPGANSARLLELTPRSLITNGVRDFVPAGGVPASRNVIDQKQCNACHVELSAHGGGRTDYEFCVTCHNPYTVQAATGTAFDMMYMTHQIHMGGNLAMPFPIWIPATSTQAGRMEYPFEEVTYPQDMRNCEDWYHVCGVGEKGDPPHWDVYESRVTRNTHTILSLLQRWGVRATFFVLGYIAEREPELIRTIAREGHEVATHGHFHRRIFEMSPLEFETDLSRSLDALSTAVGGRAVGYRAPEWSIRPHTMWALSILRKRGILYDASMVPLTRMGDRSFPRFPCRFATDYGDIAEFPLTTVRCFGENLPFTGGLPMRLAPYFYILSTIRRLNEGGRSAWCTSTHGSSTRNNPALRYRGAEGSCTSSTYRPRHGSSRDSWNTSGLPLSGEVLAV